MSVTYDFKIINKPDIPHMILIEAQNEQAYNFLTTEECLATLPNGCAPLYDYSLNDFIDDAEQAHLSCEVV